jgi:hypothetical protein
MLFAVGSRHQHKPAADVSHLISAPPGFPGPFNGIFYSKLEKQWQ